MNKITTANVFHFQCCCAPSPWFDFASPVTTPIRARCFATESLMQQDGFACSRCTYVCQSFGVDSRNYVAIEHTRFGRSINTKCKMVYNLLAANDCNRQSTQKNALPVKQSLVAKVSHSRCCFALYFCKCRKP